MTSGVETLDPFVVRMGEGEKSINVNLLVRQIAKAGQTGGEFGLIEFSGVSGTGAPGHTHGAEAEAFYIVEGTFRVGVGDIDHLAQPGDFIYVPRHVRHKWTVESEFGRFLCLITPGTGFEEFFILAGTPTTGVYAPNPEDFEPFTPREDAAELAERFHLAFVEDW